MSFHSVSNYILDVWDNLSSYWSSRWVHYNLFLKVNKACVVVFFWFKQIFCHKGAVFSHECKTIPVSVFSTLVSGKINMFQLQRMYWYCHHTGIKWRYFRNAYDWFTNFWFWGVFYFYFSLYSLIVASICSVCVASVFVEFTFGGLVGGKEKRIFDMVKFIMLHRKSSKPLWH